MKIFQSLWRILLFSLSLFLLFKSLLLFFSLFPLIFSMLESSKLDALWNYYLVYPFQLQIRVDSIKEIEFILRDKRVFYIFEELRENTISFRFGKSFVFNTSSYFSIEFYLTFRQVNCSKLGKVSSKATIWIKIFLPSSFSSEGFECSGYQVLPKILSCSLQCRVQLILANQPNLEDCQSYSFSTQVF